MTVLAHASSKEEIYACLQGPGSRAWVVHPFWMSSKMGLSLTLTFFVMFRHGPSIGAARPDFNCRFMLHGLEKGP